MTFLLGTIDSPTLVNPNDNTKTVTVDHVAGIAIPHPLT